MSLVAILDADKEGFLRSEGALIQTIGRAARHVDGTVIMYADTMTRSMKAAIDETYRRREMQIAYNEEHGITPRGIVKQVRDLTERVRAAAEDREEYDAIPDGVSTTGIIAQMPKDELVRMIKDLESQMKTSARNLEFEKAALIRDQIVELRRLVEVDPVALTLSGPINIRRRMNALSGKSSSILAICRRLYPCHGACRRICVTGGGNDCAGYPRHRINSPTRYDPRGGQQRNRSRASSRRPAFDQPAGILLRSDGDTSNRSRFDSQADADLYGHSRSDDERGCGSAG